MIPGSLKVKCSKVKSMTLGVLEKMISYSVFKMAKEKKNKIIILIDIYSEIFFFFSVIPHFNLSPH